MQSAAHSLNHRRRTLLLGVLMLNAATSTLAKKPQATAVPVQVWKDPSCGCCKDWVTHLEKNGFAATTIDQGNSAARVRLGMPQRFGSCHTALVQGYVIEGHVPASDIRRLLKDRPDALGLAVPSMPLGSPGMDGPAYEGRRHPYQVLLILKDGSAQVFNSYS
ncbi:hypothetical protein ABIC99_003975 [Sphaerotilus sulfidivorans]|jgi:hypothetical protein|uniref:DUF411 domain-containing protein n=2 Tax=Sphaerotilus sulfidivorans TaxID=639200 RepID=A0ABV2IT61_9BURK|nr:DUF411 domain-containing protein [Sphaerotilus sulfidivorans]